MAQPEIHVVSPPLKLDLGCGKHCREGFEGVDLHELSAKHKIDLWKLPLPWKDDSVDEIFCSHFLEHLPARNVDLEDIEYLPERNVDLEDFIGHDFLLAFMDECWRILKPNATMTVVVPNARHDRGFQDPTHRRFFVQQTFAYFCKAWREAPGNDLGHYLVRCNFDIVVNPVTMQEMQLLHPEAAAHKTHHLWNTVLDWHAVLKAIK